MPRSLIAVLLAAAAAAQSQNLIVNGDFEAIDGGGWTYQGENDGSHGVYSEPSNPGTNSYLLELAGNGRLGESSIRQRVAAEPGQTYELSLDLFDNCERSERVGDAQIVLAGGEIVFSRDLGAAPAGVGWLQRRIAFRARQSQIEIEIAVRGRNATREESTTAVDNVRLEKVSGIELADPLVRRAPLAPVLERQQLPIAVGLENPGWAGMLSYRRDAGRNPAMAVWDSEWNLDRDSFEQTSQAVGPWAAQGVVPILAARISAGETESILQAKHDAFFKNWARDARAWGYPVILMPWPEMDVAGDIEPKQFIRLWGHVRAIFDQEQAANVLWFWAPQNLDRESKRFYPGDEAVDIVGCKADSSGGLEAFTSSYAYAAKNFKNKAFGISETDADGAWLKSISEKLILEFPRLGFLTVSGIDPSTNEAYRNWLDSDLIQHRLPQATLPAITVNLTRKRGSVRAVLTNVGGDHVPRASKLKVEFWDAPPAAAGSTRIGREHWLTLELGEERKLDQPLPKDFAGRVHIAVDRSVDPAFLPESGGLPETQVFSESN